MNSSSLTPCEQAARTAIEQKSVTKFLDSLNSLAELTEVAHILISHGKTEALAYCRENLQRWPEPQLPAGFADKYPLVTAKLDTPPKIRVFLRAAFVRKIEVLLLGEVFEEIIRRHEVEGEQYITYKQASNGSDNRSHAIRMIYHTEWPYHQLSYLLLPDHRRAGNSTKVGVYIDWRSDDEIQESGFDSGGLRIFKSA